MGLRSLQRDDELKGIPDLKVGLTEVNGRLDLHLRLLLAVERHDHRKAPAHGLNGRALGPHGRLHGSKGLLNHAVHLRKRIHDALRRTNQRQEEDRQAGHRTNGATAQPEDQPQHGNRQDRPEHAPFPAKAQ